jgi:hypothetical protein
LLKTCVVHEVLNVLLFSDFSSKMLQMEFVFKALNTRDAYGVLNSWKMEIL